MKNLNGSAYKEYLLLMSFIAQTALHAEKMNDVKLKALCEKYEFLITDISAVLGRRKTVYILARAIDRLKTLKEMFTASVIDCAYRPSVKPTLYSLLPVYEFISIEKQCAPLEEAMHFYTE